jgi:hypothetical protein
MQYVQRLAGCYGCTLVTRALQGPLVTNASTSIRQVSEHEAAVVLHMVSISWRSGYAPLQRSSGQNQSVMFLHA